MTRYEAREIAMHLSFELAFTDLSGGALLDARLCASHFQSLAPEYDLYTKLPGPSQKQYIQRLVTGLAEHGYELDQDIERYAVGWRFDRISLVLSAILRLAMYEILYMPEIPNGAAINEAVELAKKYEGAEGARFVNGILGSFARAETVLPVKTEAAPSMGVGTLSPAKAETVSPVKTETASPARAETVPSLSETAP